MNLPPYAIFPTVSGDKILLRQILPSDIADRLEISFYDGIRATTVEQAAEMQEKIDRNYQEGDSIHEAPALNLIGRKSAKFFSSTEKGRA